MTEEQEAVYHEAFKRTWYENIENAKRSIYRMASEAGEFAAKAVGGGPVPPCPPFTF